MDLISQICLRLEEWRAYWNICRGNFSVSWRILRCQSTCCDELDSLCIKNTRIKSDIFCNIMCQYKWINCMYHLIFVLKININWWRWVKLDNLYKPVINITKIILINLYFSFTECLTYWNNMSGKYKKYFKLTNH